MDQAFQVLPKGFVVMDPPPLKKASPVKSLRPARSTWFTIKPPTPPTAQKDSTEEDEIPVLTLAHFAPSPRICFDEVNVGAEKVRRLVLKNPTENLQEVVTEKFPTSKGFSLDSEVFFVESGKEVETRITWIPREKGSVREVVIFKTSSGHKVQAIFLGTAVVPQPKKKVKEPELTCSEELNDENVESPAKIRAMDPVARRFAEKDVEFPLPGTPLRRQTYLLDSPGYASPRQVLKDLSPNQNLGPKMQVKDISDQGSDYFCRIKSNNACGLSNIDVHKMRNGIRNKIAMRKGKTLDLRRATFVKQRHHSLQDSLNQSPSSGEDSPLFDDSLNTPPSPFTKSGLEDEKRKATVPSVELKSSYREIKESSGIFFQGIKSQCGVAEPEPTQECSAIEPALNKDQSGSAVIVSPSIPEEDAGHKCYKLSMVLEEISSQSFNAQSLHQLNTLQVNNPATNSSLEERRISSETVIISCSESVPSPNLPVVKGPSFTEQNVNSNTSMLSKSTETESFNSSDQLRINSETVILTEPALSPRVLPHCNRLSTSDLKGQLESETCLKEEKSDHSTKPALTPFFAESQITELSDSVSDFSFLKSELPLNLKRCRNQKSRMNVSIATQKMKGIPQSQLSLIKPRRTEIVHHPNPFAAKNTYYDERWKEKQELCFTRWLNFVLTPPEGLSSSEQVVKVDAAKLWVESVRDTTLVRAPTKEDMSLKAYTAVRQLNRLRRAACLLYQSSPVILVISRLEVEIETGRLIIRKDKALHADVGIKQNILDMLLCYNPLWLRIGLETVYGEIINVQSNADVVGLSRFVVHRLLSNPDIAAKYAHPKVPHLYKPGYEEELKKFTLKKFLLLVYFLDQAKLTRLIDHDPCLFCKNAPFKSSRDLLISFSRDYLSGEGDVTRHLRHLGYTVSHHQRALEEFDFAVTNLAVDLRCGLRLVRVLELLLQQWTLSNQVRVPAISRLQKIYNVGLGLQALTDSGMILDESITSRDIIDGNREKTLLLLWQIIFKTQVECLIKKEKMREEILYHQKSLSTRNQLALARLQNPSKVTEKIAQTKDDDENVFNMENESLDFLLKWCQAVCTQYNIPVENFTVSFSDGRALCYLIHHYHPNVLQEKDIRQETSQSILQVQEGQDSTTLEDSFDENWTFSMGAGGTMSHKMEKLLANERENLKLAFDKMQELGGIPILTKPTDMSNTIPDEKVVITLVTYLSARLIDLSEEIRAARILQLAWKRRQIRQEEAKRKAKIKAATVIQRAVRKFLHRQQLTKRNRAATIIQCAFKCFVARKQLQSLQLEKLYQHQQLMAVIIQAAYRGFRTRKEMKSRSVAAVTLQKYVRCWKARKSYLKLKLAVKTIQSQYHAHLIGCAQRKEYLCMRSSVITIQALVRGWLTRKRLERQQRAAVVIQAVVKGWLARMKYHQIRAAVCRLQSVIRARLQGQQCRMAYLRTRHAAIDIQRWYKTKKIRQSFVVKRKATVILQAHVRSYLMKTSFKKQKTAAICLQKWWRDTKTGQKVRQDFLALRKSVVILQSHIRSYLLQKKYLTQKLAVIKLQSYFRMLMARKSFIRVRHAAVVLQQHIKATVARNKDRLKFLILRKLVVKVQAQVRMKKARKEFLAYRQAAVVLQARMKGFIARRQYLLIKNSVKRIEDRRIATLNCRREREKYLLKRNAAILIQATYRGYTKKRDYCMQKKAATKIQACVRMYQQRSQYMELCLVIYKLQKRVRAWQYGKEIRRYFLNLKQATIILQAQFRMIKARKCYLELQAASRKIQKLVRGFLVRKRFRHLKQATLVLQKRYRAKKLAKVYRRRYLIVRGATIALQAGVRGWRVRKEIEIQSCACVLIQAQYRMFRQRSDYLLMRRSAVIIQRRYRAWSLGKRTILQYHITKGAILTIQAWVRGWICRRLLQKYCNNIVTVQACIRQYLVRKNYIQLKQVVITLQRRYRAVKAGRSAKQEFHRVKTAVVTIQAAYRGWRVRQEVRQWHFAATRIQACFRRYLDRKSFLKLKQAVVVLQKFIKAYLMGQKDKAFYLSLKNSVITIQAAYRGWKLRSTLKQKRDGAITIQAFYRGHQERKRYIAKKRAIMILQTNIRAFLNGRRELEHYLVMKKAVLVIQSSWRGYQVRQRLKKEHHAAVIIQRCIRGSLARKDFQRRKRLFIRIQKLVTVVTIVQKLKKKILRKRQAATLVQAWFKGYLVRNKLQEHKASIIIQSYMKMFVARHKFLEIRAACVTLQKYVRGMRKREEFLQMYRAVIFIQQKFKAKLSGRAEYRKYHLLRNASIRVQACWRGYLVRKTLGRNRQAATKLQAAYRTYRARKQFLQLKKATILLQQRWKAKLQCRLHHQRFLQVRQSVVIIQSAYRGYVARRITKTVTSARIIQSVVRCVMVRKKFLLMRSSAVKLQSWYRMVLTRGKYQKKLRAIYQIQKYFRSWLLAKEVRKSYLEFRRSVVIIQACFRGRKYRKRFQVVRNHVVYIQASYRGQKQRQHFLLQRQAVIVIQRWFRGILENRTQKIRFERLRTNTVKLQAATRGWLVRRQVTRLKAAIKIQRWYQRALIRKRCLKTCQLVLLLQARARGWLQRQHFLRMKQQHEITVKLQAAARGFLARKHLDALYVARAVKVECFVTMVLHHLSAIRIQRFYRRILTFRLAKKQLNAVIIIQRWMRGCLQRLWFLRLRQNLILFQRTARSYLLKQGKAASIIQTQVRLWLVRRRLAKQHDSATVLQAAWRGHLQRCKLKSRQLKTIRDRLKTANANATEDKKLCNRTASALDFLLRCRNLSYILSALMHLDVVTRLSASCCEKIAEGSAVEILFQLIRSCNRSLPHMELIKYSTNILLNLAKYDKTVDSVWTVIGSLDTLLDLMRIYREKGEAIFSKVCTLLWIFFQDPEKASVMKSNKNVIDKIKSLHYLTCRRHKMEEERKITKARLSTTLSSSFLSSSVCSKSMVSSISVCIPHVIKQQPQIQPDWILGHKHMREFTDPVDAIVAVMNTLKNSKH
ncbi:abnormal spindle-like microcephaly-associated protein homolog [Limulus polyphemus]|uniref:Abnormal spindle-like microcephaly-associated protein homolog n=1 Tax=Limulus polyphemus TaxID=6850 RepID=A0ABM1BUP9_LIMPO|nr:abnormal spindle-like microcephaly-associated protein homolog [Limulus polyphemus]